MDKPSEAAMKVADDTLRTMQESMGLEYADSVDEVDLRLVASTLDAFAAEAVAAAFRPVINRLMAQARAWESIGKHDRYGAFMSAVSIVEEEYKRTAGGDA